MRNKLALVIWKINRDFTGMNASAYIISLLSLLLSLNQNLKARHVTWVNFNPSPMSYTCIQYTWREEQVWRATRRQGLEGDQGTRGWHSHSHRSGDRQHRWDLYKGQKLEVRKGSWHQIPAQGKLNQSLVAKVHDRIQAAGFLERSPVAGVLGTTGVLGISGRLSGEDWHRWGLLTGALARHQLPTDGLAVGQGEVPTWGLWIQAERRQKRPTGGLQLSASWEIPWPSRPIAA